MGLIWFLILILILILVCLFVLRDGGEWVDEGVGERMDEGVKR